MAEIYVDNPEEENKCEIFSPKQNVIKIHPLDGDK
jgi:hypothetical protein